MRQFEIAGQLLASDPLIVGERLLDRLRRLPRHAGEHLEVGLGEPGVDVTRIDLHHAHQPAVGPHHRHAHHRPDPAVEDAFVVAKPRVGCGIGRQHRTPGVGDQRHERQADPQRRDGRPLQPLGPHRQPARLRIDEQDEPSLRLRKGVEEPVEQPRKHVLRRHRGPDRAIEADDGAELRLGMLARHLAPRLRQIDLRDDHPGRVAVEDHVAGAVGGRRSRRGPRTPTGGLHEHQPLPAHRDLVAVFQPAAGRQRQTVDERAVAALQVIEKRPIGPERDGGMLPADRGGVEHDLAARMATDHGSSLGERKPCNPATSGDEIEKWHGTGSGRAARKRSIRGAPRGGGSGIARGDHRG